MTALLKEFIRSVLNEVAVAPSAAASQGLAMLAKVEGDGVHQYVLYDPKFFL